MMHSNPRRIEDPERAPSRRRGRSPVAHLNSFERYVSDKIARTGGDRRFWAWLRDEAGDTFRLHRWLWEHRA